MYVFTEKVTKEMCDSLLRLFWRFFFSAYRRMPLLAIKSVVPEIWFGTLADVAEARALIRSETSVIPLTPSRAMR